ncbi:MAG: tryptophan-rich sensory protein [Chloroflexales bacterium]|nr:tryptophan-rich sensory protein [Chloroflexales bacterium]
MSKDIIRQVTTLIAIIATITINILANDLPLNGQTAAELSARYPVPITPPGYAFSIWSLIFIGLISFAVYQALPAQRANPRLRRAGYLVVLSCIANCSWIFLWHYNFVNLSLVAMIGILLTLIAIYLRLETGRTTVSLAEGWLVRAPFSIYLGWVSLAAIVNTAVVLYNLNWNGWGISDAVWTAIMLAVGAVLAMVVMLRRADIAYGLVFVWAFVGIAVKNAASPTIVFAAGLFALLVGLVALWQVIRNRGFNLSQGVQPAQRA